MKDLRAPSGFQWRTYQNIDISLHNIPARVIRISSEDQSVLYRKIMGFTGVTDEQVAISLPFEITSIRIDTFLVPLTSAAVDFTFPAEKKSVLTINYSLHFNGTSDWISVPGGSSLSFTNAFSISAWVKASRHQSAKIVQKGDWDGLGLGQDLWNGWQTSVAFSDGTNTLVNWGSGRPVLNQWYHIAGTYDGSVVRLYINGIEVGSVPVVKTIRANNRPVSIGADAGNQKFFMGLIDEVSIWNKTLNSSEVNLGMAVGFSTSAQGLKGYWRFNEGAGATAYDSSPGLMQGVLTTPVYNTDVGYANSVDSDADGVPDSYDDYPADPLKAFDNYFPANGYGTLAFEDLWPGQGDYDFNDLVVNYQFQTVTNTQNKIVETFARFVVRAIGASMDNGFGFQFPTAAIPSSAITCTGSVLEKNYITLAANGLEAGQDKPTIIVCDDAFNVLPRQSGVSGVNVYPGNPYVVPDTVMIHLLYTPNNFTLAQLNLENFNPFLIVKMIRGREIHLPDQKPTSLADFTYFGTMNDNSDPAANRFYKTQNNLPWAINTFYNFDYPTEKSDILKAYLKMSNWAESAGAQYPDWYKNISGYRDPSFIFN